MFGITDLSLFILTALVLNATPGVDLLYTVTSTLRHGAAAGRWAALGIGAGCLVHAAAAALGLAALLATSSHAFTLIKWLGAAYLLWLAVGMLRSAWRQTPALQPTAQPEVVDHTACAVFLRGFLTNVLNPKVALFFLALLPQFVAADAASKPVAMLLLGVIFALNGTVFLWAIVWLAAQTRRLQASAGLQRALQTLGASLFMLLAARLALARQP